MQRVIIGFTGAFGSGTSYLAKNFFEKMGYTTLSLSVILREEYRIKNGKSADTRNDLQVFGNTLRKCNPQYLAEKIDEIISKDHTKNYVIEGIRNPSEIYYFRNKYTDFILIGVHADYDVRWNRVKDIYKNSKEAFDKDESKDKGVLEPNYGQRIRDCFFESDLIIMNNKDFLCNEDDDNYNNMKSKIEAYIKALHDPQKSNPTSQETLMAAAYAIGRRSKCYKRKVGAIIVDKHNRIISSGFNGVPIGLQECKSKYGKCYRDIKRKEVDEKICQNLNVDIENSYKIAESNVKLLELCRSLHAEESAILNLVDRGTDLNETTMYVTKFPCNLCANKIVQLGIKNVIYFEPYPVQEEKEIFKEANVIATPFEGVTFRAFFKFYQYEP